MKKYFIFLLVVSVYSYGQNESFTYYKADALYEEEYEKGKPTGISNILGNEVSMIKDNSLNTLTLFISDKNSNQQINFYEILNTKDGQILQVSATSEFNRNGAFFMSFPGYHKFLIKSNYMYVFYIDENQIKRKYTFTKFQVTDKNHLPKAKK